MGRHSGFRERSPVVAVGVSAQALTERLGGVWRGNHGSAACPVCQPERRFEQAALSLSQGSDGKILLYCFKSRCTFGDILAAVGLAPGTPVGPDPEAAAGRRAEARAKAEKRAEQAARLWRDARPIAGTLAERYLRGRGITCPLPPTLRFAPACWHATAQRFPAMVALVEGADGCAVHRTYLRPDGTGKADVDPPKAMLGPCAGGAVRLSKCPGPLVVAEGIETALSLLCGLLRGPATVWATLSTSGMRALRLPPQPGRLTIAGDGGAPGREAAYALAARADALGWRTSLLPAPDGRDWNDILTMKDDAA